MKSSNLAVMYALLCRDLQVMRGHIKDALIDGCILVAAQLTVFGCLFPAMGMKVELVPPLYIGSTLILLYEVVFAYAWTLIYDLEYKRTIDYRITLPIAKKWLLAQLCVSTALQATLLSLPPFVVGLLFLSRLTPITHNVAHLLLACGMYFITVLFLSTLLISFSFYYSYTWFMLNVWPRRLVPLMMFSCAFFSWHHVAAFSPHLATLFLCNPMTYCAEGLRSLLLPSVVSLPAWLCASMIILGIALAAGILWRGVYKRLDPV
ncbi:MAG TPA: hypothetical protein VLG71_00165 [Candidatus Limnocylindria bacterium]|nr:hypothetical protein [Candidatus Limnocylindria bacterium]